MNKFRLLLILLGLALVPVGRAQELPNIVGLTGYLQSETSEPVYGTVLYAVRFFADATTTTLLIPQITKGTLQVEWGHFSQNLTLPAEIRNRSAAYYELAIDRTSALNDPNWLDASDWFNQRYVINPLPASVNGPAVTFFATGGCSAGMSRLVNYSTDLGICPFITPQGPVQFQHMSIFVANKQDPAITRQCEFGIYNEAGVRIYESGLISVEPEFEGIKDVAVTGTLKPSNLYYTVFRADPSMSVSAADVPPVPGVGYILNGAPSNRLPATIDPDTVTGNLNATIVHVGFR